MNNETPLTADAEPEEPKKRRVRKRSPELEAMHEVAGVMDELTETDFPFVYDWFCRKYGSVKESHV